MSLVYMTLKDKLTYLDLNIMNETVGVVFSEELNYAGQCSSLSLPHVIHFFFSFYFPHIVK